MPITYMAFLTPIIIPLQQYMLKYTILHTKGVTT
jgi:hypothetical protein